MSVCIVDAEIIISMDSGVDLNAFGVSGNSYNISKHNKHQAMQIVAMIVYLQRHIPRVYHCVPSLDLECSRADCDKSASINTSDVIASTIGTALGTTQGSCLPFASKTPFTASYETVDWAWPIVAGDLKATRK